MSISGRRTMLVVIAVVVAMLALPALAATVTITYTGQGFILDGSTANLKSERCGAAGQGVADDGGTGQFADWNGPGQPYQAGQGYLLWVLTLNASPEGGVQLHLPDGTVDMIQVGGTWKYASQYYNFAQIANVVTATFDGADLDIRGRINLVVSHGCQPFETQGAWCSPGYWRNASDASWALTGYAKTDLFNDTVVPDFYDTAYISEALPNGPTLIQVLTTAGANTFGSASGPWVPNLNAFNATGAFLTDQIPGFSFNPALIGQENACPIDNHGNFK